MVWVGDRWVNRWGGVGGEGYFVLVRIEYMVLVGGFDVDVSERLWVLKGFERVDSEDGIGEGGMKFREKGVW